MHNPPLITKRLANNVCLIRQLSGILLRYGALVVLIPGLFSGCVTFEEPTKSELNVMVTAEDLAPFRPEHTIDFARVKAQKLQVAGISLLTYEYQPGRALYLSSEVSVGPNGSGEEHAARSLRGFKTASWIQGDDLEMEEQPIQGGLAGGARFFLLRSSGKPIGNAYITYDDQRAMSLMFSGVYFSDLDQFSHFIKPKLKALTNYSPRPTSS